MGSSLICLVLGRRFRSSILDFECYDGCLGSMTLVAEETEHAPTSFPGNHHESK